VVDPLGGFAVCGAGNSDHDLSRVIGPFAPSTTCAGPSKAWGSFMNVVLVVAILAISAVPVYAQEQRANTEKLKADAQNVFKIISGDKLKVQTYCKIADLSQQLDRASRKKDTKKVEELAQSIDELETKLGPRISLAARPSVEH
jgi:Tfp pilus assembly protein PilE